MIKAKGLRKLYSGTEAVSDVSFEIAEGQIVGFLGPNGAGKTTTIRMLTTFLSPTEGSAEVAGFDTQKNAADVRKSIGYLPETPPLYPELKVKEYLEFVGSIKGMGRKEVRTGIERVLEQCQLEEVSSKLCSKISKGFKQRVGLAAALIHEPKVILLDEPTSGLDPVQIIEIRSLIKDLANEHTVILSTHILNEVVETCSHAIIISKGRVAAQGEIAKLTETQSLEEHFMEAISK